MGRRSKENDMKLKTKTKKSKYPSRSTAARTKMLTVCKGCKKSNDNGYQYCTACHKEHRGKGRSKSTPCVVQAPAVDPDEVRKVLGNEGCEAGRSQ
jgi:hypothetical protein